MRQSYKPIVLPSVSIVLCIILNVLLGYLSGFQSFKLLVQLSSWTMNAVVNTSLSQVLHFVGLSIRQSRPVCRQSYFFVVILIHQSRPMYRKSFALLYVGLLIRLPREYRNDRTTSMTIPVDYFNDFSLVTSCLAFLGTMPN